jgi:hypothetical protein
MDPLGRRGFLRAPCDRGVTDWLAAMGPPDIGHRDAPRFSLVIPAATLVNVIFFHILPTIAQSRASPGFYTATLLYVPFSSWALLGAWRDGVPGRAIAEAMAAGTRMMVGVVLGAKSLGA